MDNMDKELTVPKWVLINRPKIPQNLSAQIVCPSPKFWDFDEKRLHWTSVVRASTIVSRHLESHFYFSYFCVGCMLLLRYVCARSSPFAWPQRLPPPLPRRAAHYSQPQGRVRRARRRRRRYRCVSWHFAI